MNHVYSFQSVTATLVGPGVVANLGNGSAAAEEGIEINATGDINVMTIGSDGEGLHSLQRDKSGTVTVSLLKNSPMNRVLSAAYAFQTDDPSSHGQNTFTLVDKLRGDVIVAQQCAFKKAPDLGFAKVGKTVAWEFHAIRIERTLGA